MYPELVSVALKMAHALEGLGVPYFIGGSLASAIHGVVRPSQDVDVMAALQQAHAGPLMAVLRSEFHYEPYLVERAIAERGRFAAVHLSRVFRVDVFVAGAEPYARVQLERRRKETVSVSPRRAAYFATAEDIVLAKLDCYRDGAARPERQWADVVGVLRVRGQTLDQPYMGHWADQLGLTRLLRRALYEAQLGPVAD